MHAMLKEAYSRGLEHAVQSSAENAEDAYTIKEAVDWRRALSVFDPVRNAAQRILSPSQAAGMARAGGTRAVNLAGQVAKKRGLAAAGQSALARHALLSGAGAGVGALAGGEGNRGRGAVVGALGGLGLSAGAGAGGLKSFGNTISVAGRRAARQVQRGSLAPEGVHKFMQQQLTAGPLKHDVARQLIGAGVAGGAGATGATMLANKLIPHKLIPQQQQAQVYGGGQYGQALGLTPAEYQHYGQYPQMQQQFQ